MIETSKHFTSNGGGGTLMRILGLAAVFHCHVLLACLGTLVI